MGRLRKGYGTMMVCGSLSLSDSVLRVWWSSTACTSSVLGSFYSQKGLNVLLGSSQPASLSLPEASQKETFH